MIFQCLKFQNIQISFKSSKHPEVYDLTSMIFESNNVPWIDEFLKFISKPKNK
ncbi:hypothetical protein ONA24_06285 [Mycoplasmopsis cynos]|uniref:hypothetical protein n=1 Tax=Mycoplasmopsis cynos TaxID=171284 RepID=UPI0024CADB3A|nr:hypothetical protein [Mycoplasmopsis cynos]WAM09560.1 hypothetical protein ONA24_06285 [Mycoplasmopsis cynos]